MQFLTYALLDQLLFYYMGSSVNSENRWVKFQNISSSKAPLEKENLVLYESVITFLITQVNRSYMLVLATPSSTVHNTKYLDPYH